MDTRRPDEVTQLLQAWGRGDRAALGRLVPIVYGELRRLARHSMRGERRTPGLQTVLDSHARGAMMREVHRGPSTTETPLARGS
jgi:hypothetical protein